MTRVRIQSVGFRVELSLPPGAPVDHLPAHGVRDPIVQVRGASHGRVAATPVDEVVHVRMCGSPTHLAVRAAAGRMESSQLINGCNLPASATTTIHYHRHHHLIIIIITCEQYINKTLMPLITASPRYRSAEISGCQRRSRGLPVIGEARQWLHTTDNV